MIGDRPLQELVPLYRDPKTGMRVTQYNMKWVEQAGLVKFDFLGLKTLTVLRTAVDLIRRKRGIEIDLSALPLDDPKTYEPLRRGETVGVFQVESAGMRKALVEMEADRFEDIIALVALYRPGPMANIPVYCARKLGKDDAQQEALVSAPEARADPARDLRDHRLPGTGDGGRARSWPAIRSATPTCCAAPWARRSRRRWTPSASASSRAPSSAGSTRRKANEIFDLLAKFADYGFNKSHAAAYALVAFQTAYLKANYPVEFLAASMTLDLDNTDKLVGIPPRGAAPRHQGRAALDQPLRRRVRRARREGRARSATRSPPSRASAGRPSRRSSRRGATSPSGTSPISPAASTRASSTSAPSKT